MRLMNLTPILPLQLMEWGQGERTSARCRLTPHSPSPSDREGDRGKGRTRVRLSFKLRALCLLAVSFCAASHAALQFDVFLGYDLVVPEATWFPVVCEIKNDGPSFNGVIELNGAGLVQGQSHRVAVELPTGTLKRLTIPLFSTTRGFNTSWDVRLLDERGKVRAEQNGLR